MEVNNLKSKLEQIEQEFAFKENNMTPKVFLKVLDKLKVRLNENIY